MPNTRLVVAQGIDTRDIGLATLRTALGLVPQARGDGTSHWNDARYRWFGGSYGATGLGMPPT